MDFNDTPEETKFRAEARAFLTANAPRKSTGRPTLRLGGMVVMVFALLKAFGYDLWEIGGLWRIASLLGLGLCLIGVGWLYTRFVQEPKPVI